MMKNALSCTGFVPDFSPSFVQTSVITYKKNKTWLSCTDHQSFFTRLAESHLSISKSLSFFDFSELFFQFRILRLSANTHVERRFECFGFVPEKFQTLVNKQNSFNTYQHVNRGDLWHASLSLAQMETRLLGCAIVSICKSKRQRIT